MNCTIIGLTGSSGSGKSEAAKFLSGFGAKVIDADEISHNVVKNRETLNELACALGGWVLDEQGAFNRARVSERAFSDPEFLSRLTEITHRYIVDEVYRRVDALKSAYAERRDAGGKALVIVIDAPIPVKKGFLDISDVVWVVKSERARRLERVKKRDGIGAAAAQARFSSQMPDGEYEKLADVVIDNDGGLAELERELRGHYEKLLGGL